MPLVIADRVRETTSSTGTGTITLTGAFSGFQPFSTIGNGNTTYYCIIDAAAGAFEVGIGTYTTTGNTLSRDTVLSSSNGGAAVSFAVGLKDVICTQPSARAVYVEGSDVVARNNAKVPNSLLANSGITFGATAQALGSTVTALNGVSIGGTTAGAGAFTTLAASGAVTLDAATANGVAFANASKVLTTGSALTFDGNNFTQSGASSAVQLLVNTANSGISASNYSEIVLADVGVGRTFWRSLRDGSGATIFSGNNHIRYALLGSEQMRLTTTGLGIGTSSPVRTLSVLSASSIPAQIESTGTDARISIVTSSGSGGQGFIQASSGALLLGSSNTERLRLDSSGNLGLGVTPSAWLGSYRAMQFTGGAVQGGTAGLFELYANNFRDGNGNFIYSSTNAAARYSLADAHRWFIAPSGTAGNAITFTQAATLTADGNFVVGATNSDFRLRAIVEGGANRDIFQAAVSGISNAFTIKWNHATATIRMNIQNLPTSATGLASGDLYVLAGALMVA